MATDPIQAEADRFETWLEHARQEEREACAKLAEELFPPTNGPGWLAQDGKRIVAHEVAAAIRARR